MLSRTEEAWARAADCAVKAEEAIDARTRALFTTLRDSYIQVANNLELIAGYEKHPGKRN